MGAKRVPVARRRFEARIRHCNAAARSVAVNGQVVCAAHGALRVVLFPVPECDILVVGNCVSLHLDLPGRLDSWGWLNRVPVVVLVMSDCIVIKAHHSGMWRMRGRRAIVRVCRGVGTLGYRVGYRRTAIVSQIESKQLHVHRRERSNVLLPG